MRTRGFWEPQYLRPDYRIQRIIRPLRESLRSLTKNKTRGDATCFLMLPIASCTSQSKTHKVFQTWCGVSGQHYKAEIWSAIKNAVIVWPRQNWTLLSRPHHYLVHHYSWAMTSIPLGSIICLLVLRYNLIIRDQCETCIETCLHCRRRGSASKKRFSGTRKRNWR